MIPISRLRRIASSTKNKNSSLPKTFALLLGGLALGGCSRTSSTTPTNAAAPRATATLSVPNLSSENARSSRDNNKLQGKQSKRPLTAKDYKGVLDSRLKILDAQTRKPAAFGAPDFYAVQSLAIVDLPRVASRLDAASCRSYAARLKALDARVPSYATILQQEKASQLANLAKRHKDPKFWREVTATLGRTPQQQQALNRMSVAQIGANITKIYDAAIAASAKPYSPQEIKVAVDPYTSALASPSIMNRFLWTKFKTERLLAIVALQNKADALENKSQTAPLPADPFGSGPLKRKNKEVYSVGPDTKDDGGKPIERPNYAQISDKGDILAPTL